MLMKIVKMTHICEHTFAPTLTHTQHAQSTPTHYIVRHLTHIHTRTPHAQTTVSTPQWAHPHSPNVQPIVHTHTPLCTTPNTTYPQTCSYTQYRSMHSHAHAHTCCPRQTHFGIHSVWLGTLLDQSFDLRITQYTNTYVY